MPRKYNTKSILKLEELDHIRQRPGMYIGHTGDPTKLLIECLDNAIDEVENGHADKIIISLDTKNNVYMCADNGRGIPFDYKLKLEEDPPILICNNIFTSGKFKKDEDDSAYKISAGLHGVGLTCVNALSDYMIIDLFKDSKRAQYVFKHGETPKRNPLTDNSSKNKYKTVITFKPCEKYFDSLIIDEVLIKERLLIAVANFPNLEVLFKIDDDIKKIAGGEDELIENYLGKKLTWHDVELKNSDKTKKHEYAKIKFSWDFDNKSTKMEKFTSVNFVKVSDGIHINTFNNILKEVCMKYAKKYDNEFEENDVLNWLRLYINLKIVDVHFDAQIKERLGKKTDLSIFDNLKTSLDNYFKNNENFVKDLLEKFEIYRKSIQNKRVTSISNSKKGSTKHTKLIDCLKDGGELLIGEGDSAMGSLKSTRDKNIHAIMPLLGVPLNVTKASTKQILENKVIQDMVMAMGCGIESNYDSNKLRYSKIIICADADSAGSHIMTLLIMLFAKLTPNLIKDGKLYVCQTPLYGTGTMKKFKPLWTDEELEEARSKNVKIRRFKGLGEFNPEELEKFILNPTERKLIQIKWDEDIFESLKNLFKSPRAKRQLVSGTWEPGKIYK